MSQTLAEVQEMFENDSDPGIHASAEWLLRKWGLGEGVDGTIAKLSEASADIEQRWFVSKERHTMVVLDLRQTGSIDHVFAIAAKETTVEQFRRFRGDYVPYEPSSPTPDCPANIVSWYDAAAYCNWLTMEEGLGDDQLCYEMDPSSGLPYPHLGVAFLDTGRVQEAIAHLETAVQLDPKYAEAYNFLGIAFMMINQVEKAIPRFERAVIAKPDDAKLRGNLNRAMATMDQTTRDVQQYEEAIKESPDSPELHAKLGNAFVKIGRVSEAIEQFERVLQIRPDDAEVQSSLAWLLATRGSGNNGNPTRAVSLAQRACQLTEHKSAECLDSLAAAYAACGQFPEAIAAAKEAIQLATTQGQAPLAKRIEIHLACYRLGHAYDESVPPVKQPAP